jgi:hypothetical protein
MFEPAVVYRWRKSAFHGFAAVGSGPFRLLTTMECSS